MGSQPYMAKINSKQTETQFIQLNIFYHRRHTFPEKYFITILYYHVNNPQIYLFLFITPEQLSHNLFTLPLQRY
jgi:hypothetical protein